MTTPPVAPPAFTLLAEEAAARLLTLDIAYRAVADALVAAARGEAQLNPVVIGKGLEDGQSFSIKSGAARGAALVGLKVGSYWPGAEHFGLARHGSTVLLLDVATGRLRALVEAARLNGPRTAAADAVACDRLARSDAATLGVIGAGHQAIHEIRAVCAVRAIERVCITSRDRARAERLAAELGGIAGEVRAAGLEETVRRADILVTVTNATAPLFDDDWVRPGTHISAMGADQAGKQELPPALLRRAACFCDLPSQSLAIGEFQHVADAVRAGEIALAAIGDVVSGAAAGRPSRDAITVFDSSGLAVQDLYVAQAVLDAAAAA